MRKPDRRTFTFAKADALVLAFLVVSVTGCDPRFNVSVEGSVGGRDASTAADGFFYVLPAVDGKKRVTVLTTDVVDACAVFSQREQARADAFAARDSVIETHGATSEEGYAAHKTLGKSLIQIDADLLPANYFETRLSLTVSGEPARESGTRVAVGDGASIRHCTESEADVYAGIPYLRENCHLADHGVIEQQRAPEGYTTLVGESRFVQDGDDNAVEKLAFEVSVPRCTAFEDAALQLAAQRE